ncbi:MAG: hypothetical protein KDD04_08080, partial [Sinomicrobium sp.]|nr:hypothetical protein [Sinomicrobium sp.]
MKKNIAIAAVSVLLAGFLCGCISSGRKTDATPETTGESQSDAVDVVSVPESDDEQADLDGGATYETLDG